MKQENKSSVHFQSCSVSFSKDKHFPSPASITSFHLPEKPLWVGLEAASLAGPLLLSDLISAPSVRPREPVQVCECSSGAGVSAGDSENSDFFFYLLLLVSMV